MYLPRFSPSTIIRLCDKIPESQKSRSSFVAELRCAAARCVCVCVATYIYQLLLRACVTRYALYTLYYLSLINIGIISIVAVLCYRHVSLFIAVAIYYRCTAITILTLLRLLHTIYCCSTITHRYRPCRRYYAIRARRVRARASILLFSLLGSAAATLKHGAIRLS